MSASDWITCFVSLSVAIYNKQAEKDCGSLDEETKFQGVAQHMNLLKKLFLIFSSPLIKTRLNTIDEDTPSI